MVCPKCNGEIWDNRQKKIAGEMKPNAPDFSCKDKQGCGWVQWPPKAKASPVATAAPIASQSAPQPQGNGAGRDAQLVRLYWDCFDEIIAGLKAGNRMMASGFPAEQIAAMTSTLYIARSKIL